MELATQRADLAGLSSQLRGQAAAVAEVAAGMQELRDATAMVLSAQVGVYLIFLLQQYLGFDEPQARLFRGATAAR